MAIVKVGNKIVKINGRLLVRGGASPEPQITEVVIGSKTYPVVKIGNKHWLAENLDLTWNGLYIGGAPSNYTFKHAWYYNNQQSLMQLNKYNLLYNWYAVRYLEDHKDALLPIGWRVPTENDYVELTTELGGASTAASKMKTSIWNGDNSSGLSMLPGGFQDSKASSGFNSMGKLGCFWALDEHKDGEHALGMELYSSSTKVNYTWNWKVAANSLRLIMD